jgi:hypothetical protein
VLREDLGGFGVIGIRPLVRAADGVWNFTASAGCALSHASLAVQAETTNVFASASYSSAKMRVVAFEALTNGSADTAVRCASSTI